MLLFISTFHYTVGCDIFNVWNISMCMLYCSGCQSLQLKRFLNKFATFHDLNAHMSILRHQYLFQMLGICIYDIWERFCVAKINITNFTSKNCSTTFSFFAIYLYIHFWLVTKLVQGNLGGTFNPKSRRVLSMKKCIEQVVPRQWSESEQNGALAHGLGGKNVHRQ